MHSVLLMAHGPSRFSLLLRATGFIAACLLIAAYSAGVQASPSQNVATAWGQYQPICCGPIARVDEQWQLRLIERQGTGTVQVHFLTPTATNRYVVIASNMQSSNPVSVFTKTTDGFWLSTGACECAVSFVVFGGN